MGHSLVIVVKRIHTDYIVMSCLSEKRQSVVCDNAHILKVTVLKLHFSGYLTRQIIDKENMNKREINLIGWERMAGHCCVGHGF